MFIRCIILLTIAFMTIQGEIHSSIVKSDAEKFTNMFQNFTKISFVMKERETFSKMCPWFIKCCPDEFKHFASGIIQGTFCFDCFNSAKNLTTSIPSCANNTFGPSTHEKQPSYENVIAKSIQTWIKQIENTCSSDEITAFYCEKNAFDKIQSCQVKTFELIAKENDVKNYAKYVTELEQELLKLRAML